MNAKASEAPFFETVDLSPYIHFDFIHRSGGYRRAQDSRDHEKVF